MRRTQKKLIRVSRDKRYASGFCSFGIVSSDFGGLRRRFFCVCGPSEPFAFFVYQFCLPYCPFRLAWVYVSLVLCHGGECACLCAHVCVCLSSWCAHVCVCLSSCWFDSLQLEPMVFFLDSAGIQHALMGAFFSKIALLRIVLKPWCARLCVRVCVCVCVCVFACARVCVCVCVCQNEKESARRMASTTSENRKRNEKKSTEQEEAHFVSRVTVILSREKERDYLLNLHMSQSTCFGT